MEHIKKMGRIGKYKLLGCFLFLFAFLSGCTTDLCDTPAYTVEKTDLSVIQSDKTKESATKTTPKKEIGTYSQQDKMNASAYIMKDIENDVYTPERELISFDNGVSWEYYEHRIKCYFPAENVYRWERYCPQDGEKQISIDDGETWYYIRENPQTQETEVSIDKKEWIDMPSVETWTMIKEDDPQYKSGS